MFTTTDALHARQRGIETVGNAMTVDLVLAFPADSLHTALQRMTRAGVSRLPVVEREHPERLIGILTTRDLSAALDLEVNALASEPANPMAVLVDDPLRSILVRAAMVRQFEIVPESASLTHVANRLAGSRQHAVLTVDDTEALTGIATIRDLQQATMTGVATDGPIGSVASRHLVVARPTESVAEALAQPGAEGLRQLPVVEEQDGEAATGRNASPDGRGRCLSPGPRPASLACPAGARSGQCPSKRRHDARCRPRSI